MLVTQSDMTDTINMLSQRIDQVAAQLVQMEKNNIARFEQMQENMTVRFEAMNDRFGAINNRFDAVNKQFDAINKQFDAVHKQLAALRWFQGVSIAFLALVTALLAINIF